MSYLYNNSFELSLDILNYYNISLKNDKPFPLRTVGRVYNDSIFEFTFNKQP